MYFLDINMFELYPICCRICEFPSQYTLGSPRGIGQKVFIEKDVSLGKVLRLGNS